MNNEIKSAKMQRWQKDLIINCPYVTVHFLVLENIV